MNVEPEQRAALLGEYIAEHNATVRAAARAFGCSKSTVHKDVSTRLRAVDAALFARVQAVLARVDAAGIVGGVSYRTPVGNDAQFYKDIPVCPMTYGQAMAILMLAEALYHTGEDA